jgi:amino acid adenylation domain-containing protein
MLHHRIKFKDSIARALLQIEKQYANNPALAIGNETYSYQKLFNLAKQLAAQLMYSKANRCLILSGRNVTAYVSLLGALLAGKAYVFLNTKESALQLSQMILLTKTDLLIVDDLCLPVLNELISYLPMELTIVRLNQQRQFTMGRLDREDNLVDRLVDSYAPPENAYQYAYMMFTSGSTGKPKGVPISHKNLITFIDNVCDRIKPTVFDKFSHINELTFDFSVYEIFCCWFSGACLCVLPDNYLYGIDKYINKHQITYWSSVPSVVQLLSQLKKLDKENFQSIRYSIFCGEALTRDTAKRWKLAAPNTIVDNLYGPTEATVAITGYLWHEHDSDGVVPIGQPFPGQGFYLVDELNQVVETGEIGEIYLCGDQVATEYWNNSEITRSRFTIFNGKPSYKTGDLALFDQKKGLIFKGRKDDQLKLNGYRVEKIDIENRIKTILQTQAIAVVALKDNVTDQVMSLMCFFSETDYLPQTAKKLCRKMLPHPMIPDEFIKLEALPYNKNGKIDYKVLMRGVVTKEV